MHALNIFSLKLEKIHFQKSSVAISLSHSSPCKLFLSTKYHTVYPGSGREGRFVGWYPVARSANLTQGLNFHLQFPTPKTIRRMGTSFQNNDFWLVNGCLEYHRPVTTNACPPKQSQKSLHPKLVPVIQRASEVGKGGLLSVLYYHSGLK